MVTVRPIWASLTLASVMLRMLGQSAFGSKTTCIFRPRMRPFALPPSHSLPSGMGVESISFRAVAPRLPIELAGEQAEGLGEDRNRSPFVGIGQGRADQRAAAQVVMMLAAGVPTRFQAAQAGGRGKLGVDQRQEMVPAGKRFDVGIAGVPRHERVELAALDRFQQLTEDARCETHASSFF